MTTSVNAPTMTEAAVREISTRHHEPEWLLERRLAAHRAFEAMAMPDPVEEEWRRTDISRFDFAQALGHAGDPTIERRAVALPDGVVFADLHEAATLHEVLLKDTLHSLVQPTEWKLSALQAASWQDGALIYVPPGVEVEVPLRYLIKQNGAPAYPHLLIVADVNSSVTVIQETAGESPQGYSLINGAVEIIARQDARVRFVDIQTLGDNGVFNFSTMRANLDRGADLSAALIGLGSLLTKAKLEVSLAGEGCHAELFGVSFGNGKQHFDYTTLQDHTGPRSTSDLTFKAALDDHSSMVWTGTVRIQKGASQSEANQASRNLLLSDKAKAAPIPVLEIEAHDVLKCSHGATAGPIDEDQRFYLESRGIPPKEAQQLLVEAFFQEIVDRLPAMVEREPLETMIREKIGASV